MSLPLDLLFNQVAKAIGNHSSDRTPGPSYDANPLLGGLQGLFSQFAGSHGQQFNPNQQYGDPQEFYNQYGRVDDDQQGQVASSDSDPFGDPGLQGGGGGQNIRSSDEDPFGDPGLQR
ncbi:MAG: hypothetical protein JWN98_1172 [Abditibacteriota bacterium]|nr:hypothetical protein [Abditibacteriota bacterium]